MSEHLPTYTYGVDIAMWKLRPGAQYQLEGTNFTQWSDPNGLQPPAWEEVMAQIEKDRAFAAELEARHKAEHEGVAQMVASVETNNPPPPSVVGTLTPTTSEFAKPIPIAGSK